METPRIETERMLLRPIRIDDAKDIFERWTDDERVARYMRWTPHGSYEVTQQWINSEIDNNAEGKSYQWVFTQKDTGYLFGSGGIFMNEDEKCYEIGYQLMYTYWNKGYATEAARAIIDFTHNELKQSKMVAGFAVGNEASGKVMEKCGFVYERDGSTVKFDGITKLETKRYILTF